LADPWLDRNRKSFIILIKSTTQLLPLLLARWKIAEINEPTVRRRPPRRKSGSFPGFPGGERRRRQDSSNMLLTVVQFASESWLNCCGLCAIIFALINNELHLLIEVRNQWASVPRDKCCQRPFVEPSFD